MARLLLTFLAFSVVTNIFGQRRIDIYSNKSSRGQYCYILWTSDTAKCNPKDTTSKLIFDKKNIVYVHFDMLQTRDSIRVFTDNGQNISKHMINIMSGDSYQYLSFYNPTDNEIKHHPYYDIYYTNKLPGKLKEYWPKDFEKMGYTVERRKID